MADPAAGMPAGMGMPSVEEMQMQQAQMAQMEEQRKSILDQILEPAAADRLRRLALVRKDTARAVEDSLIKAATTGKLAQMVSEAELIKMLDKLCGGTGGGTGEGEGGGGPKKKITIQRRKYGIDDDDDDDNDDDLM
jgi:programmed cell death protein 5